ncbi:DUF3408 domain-containing protein [uncultured Dysgonomonas sp.]|uniref:Conjugative transposon protein TraB n=1 Tax=uncultured Dysgonomonas sp. TaxID=206096 RepID=A0A212K862_9BACT|nr:DUF3408 domain-containing protein [uncultured Dysgonomonas sp.]SBW07856.1 Conjugative transposon protein TraB [uncultured Dysgonomonas sp.]
MKRNSFFKKAKSGQPKENEIPNGKQDQQMEYQDTFLKHQEFRARQCVYLSQEVHASISRIVHVLALTGNKISVGGYIDNIITEHLKTHKELLDDIYRKQLDQFL